MTPKEKALELIKKFRIHQPVWEVRDDAKQCALIAVNEVIEALNFHQWQNRNEIEWWNKVKEEIEKI